jgi:hypothetical protein
MISHVGMLSARTPACTRREGDELATREPSDRRLRHNRDRRGDTTSDGVKIATRTTAKMNDNRQEELGGAP